MVRTSRSLEKVLLGVVGLVAVLAWGVESAAAPVIHVENYGVDGASCGSPAGPCRSISQAISNAGAGGAIVVGPGWYNEKQMVIAKPLTVESSAGAAATTVNLFKPDPSGPFAVVTIYSSHVTFGRRDRGFTINANGYDGVLVLPWGFAEVGGNVVVGANRGFIVATLQSRFLANTAQGSVLAGFDLDVFLSEIADNVATGTTGSDGMFGHGFRFRVDCAEPSAPQTNTIRNNVASDNYGHGFDVYLLGDETCTLPPTAGTHTYELRDNTASGNGQAGFSIVRTGHTLRGNVAVGNDIGILVDGSAHTVKRNAVVANGSAGIWTRTTDVTITQNNIFGNGIAPKDQKIPGNCGLVNDSGGALSSPKNFWGAATGPGPDPADDVCNVGKSSTTDASPFAPGVFPIP